MGHMQQTFGEFFLESIKELIKNHVTVTFNKARRVEDCGGWFDEVDRELIVATGALEKRWKQIFVHEFCHYRQWKEKSPWFFKYGKGYGACNFWDWLTEGEEPEDMSPYHRKAAINYYLGLEADCERRAIKLIRERGLEIDIEDYIKGANAYLYMYPIIEKDGVWCSNKAPYRVPEIMEMMPGDDLVKDFRKPPRGYVKLLREECFKYD